MKFKININMSNFLQRVVVCFALMAMPFAMQAQGYQVTNANFEDWSGAAFNGEAQPKGWNASNVEQVGMKFNFAHKEAGRNGGYCMMVQDQSVGAMGITETSPGYFAIGQPWAYLPSITAINQATAGTSGGQSWTHRPDTMSVWIRRTGNDWDKEDFYLLYYAWKTEAHGTQYKGKNGGCTSHEETNEESDVRIAMNGNECKTTVKGDQVCEGMWRERANYNNWTNIRVPIYYFNDNAPRYMNMIFSASNYPNFRANDGLYVGNSLYVDDVELIYSSKIQTLRIGGKEWKGFDPNSTDVQVYSVPEGTTTIPTIAAFRGAGSLTNAKGTTKSFPGRELTGSEITITNGTIGGTPTTIVVRAEDGSSTTTYQILFQAEASSNAKLANIFYTYTDKDGNAQRVAVSNFNPNTYTYRVEVPYGAQGVPTVDVEQQEDEQSVAITQAQSATGKATIVVTAANGTSKATYTINFEPGLLADNTLQDILVNGTSIPGFTPSQAVYKVSLPTSTTTMPTITPVSAYPAGEQTIVCREPSVIDGGTYTISVTTPGNPVAKVYKLNFRLEASSYSYLKDLKVEGSQIWRANPARTDDSTAIAFTPAFLTYYVNLVMGTTELPEISWEPGDEYQTITKADLPAGAVDGTVRITVTAGNGDQTTYKIIFTTEKSDRSTLNGILIGGVPMEGFLPDRTSYTYALPVGTTELPTIEPVLGDEWQTYSITTAGLNGKTRITVTAGDGSTTIYQISFSVAAYTDNTLKSLSVEGYDIGFEPEKDEYWVSLPQGTTVLPAVQYELQNEAMQTVAERPLLNGLNGDYKITVRPHDGASRTYIIHFSVATSSNVKLGMIYVDGAPLANFHPDTLHYTYRLPEGVSTIPTVTFDKGEASQRVLNVLEGKKQIITVTAESGDKEEYTITFLVQVSQNAFLDMIYLDGDSLADFRKDSLNYEVTLSAATCPAITVDKAPGQQVTVSAPYATGLATIKVKPEEGAANTYTINFVPVAVATVQLSDILVNGVSLEGFQPTKMSYEAAYSNELPEVTGVAASGQVTVLWKGEKAWLYVTDDEGNKAVYSVSFSRTKSGEKALEAIYADGVLISGFNAATHDYSYELEAGSAYPEITYQAKDNTQVIFCGQLETGKFGITVVAEDGTTALYTVSYTIKPYTDATLKDLDIEGFDLVYSKTQQNYGPFQIPEGEALPKVYAVPEAGQSVFVYDVSETKQEILVMAESGAEMLYTITYTRVGSNNVQLANILIDGVALDGFYPEKTAYTITLPRNAEAVPNVNPVAQLDNQTVTTYVCRPDGVTRIVVEAQDGSTGEYTIAFPLEKSDDTELQSLIINSETKDVTMTDYTFTVPFSQVEPYDVVYKAKFGQQVRYIEAPISGTTQIIVTNEKGNNSRTYSIRYNVSQPQGENAIKRVNYSYVNAAGESKTGSINAPAAGENIVELPYGSKSFEVTSVEKTFAEQSVYLTDGGIRHGAQIIVASNRANEEDVTYTIVPRMPEFDKTGKLKVLKFKGDTIPNFRPDVYHYVVKTSTQPSKTSFVGSAYSGSYTRSELDTKNKKITLTVNGGETYTISWYYTNYESLLDFSGDWVPVSKGVGYKPSTAWKVPGDCDNGDSFEITGIVNLIYTTGKEVAPGGVNGVLLSTLRGAPMNTSVPGMMTLGGMSMTLGNSGSSSSSVTKSATAGAAFKNTPEALAFDVKPLSTTNITNWKLWLTMSDGTNYTESNYTGDFSNMNKWESVQVPITMPTNAVSKFNIMLSSCDQEDAAQFNGSTIYESMVMYDNIHFVYNSALTKAFLDGATEGVDPVENVFTFAVGSDYAGVPSLKFTGATEDQTRTIEWINGGEWINGELKARVVNFGENLKDSTVYTVVLQRPVESSLAYTADFGTLGSTRSNDTVYVNLPHGTTSLPGMTIKPASMHQVVAMSKKGNAVTVTVSAENGTDSTTVYVFREELSHDPQPETWSPETGSYSTVDAEHYIYSITASKMPMIEVQKKEGQLIEMRYTLDSVLFTVTAADGVTTRTFTVRRQEPSVTTTGQISSFTKGGSPWTKLGGDTYDATDERPTETILYERSYPQDSIVYIQAPDKMEWQVYGSENHTYVLSYPTVQSSNANLADILINGVSYDEFSPTDFEYTIELDSFAILKTVEAESTQQLVTSQASAEGEEVVYTTVVTAEDGTQQTYKVTIRRAKSPIATLAGILLDGVMIDSFDPNTFAYTVELPVPAVKKEQPKMPSITYIAGHPDQKVTITNAGELNGNPTELDVQPGKGSNNIYTVTVRSAASGCVDLTGILINGEAVEQFESGRHFYSHSLHSSEIEVDYTSDDRFQTVTTKFDTIKVNHQYRCTLHVQAENGNETDYEVMIYVENQSSDAQLANITLDGYNFEDFERALNPDLTFDGGNNNYIINLPSGTTVLPEVSAQLKMEGQSVEIIQKTDSILLNVKAVDGTVNPYTLKFLVPLSKNADLGMIFLDGDSLPDFDPSYYFYQVELPVGVHSMPEVAVQRGEAGQKVLPIQIDEDKLQVTIKVQAEDPDTRENTYVVVFRLTQSDADKLNMIYQDGKPLEGFAATTMYYALSLEVGTSAFPDLSWQEQDDWQTIHMDTVESTANTLIRQIYVQSESGKKNTYTVSYTIEKSDVDYLQMIFVDQKQLAGFAPSQTEYYVTLTAAYANELNGQMPSVEYITGDEYQTVMISQMPEDSLSSKNLGYKSIITVTAATGKTRLYTIHYPVELSSEATLNMINLGGKPLANYDSERFNYKVEIEKEASVPVVSVIKKEDAQVYEIQVVEDTVLIFVTAEDVNYHNTYRLTFERLKSANTKLREIILTDEAGETFLPSQFPYRPEVYSYIVNLQYKQDKDLVDQLPEIEVVFYEDEQTADTTIHILPTGDIQVDVTVTAPNEEDQAIYSITFHFVKPADALLISLSMHGEEFADFRPTKSEYTYVHPFGTDSAAYFTEADVTYVLSDSLAADTIFMDEFGVINIVITAQDGSTSNTYRISQVTAQDGDNALAWITIDGTVVVDFDPEKTFYTYYIFAGGAVPEIDAAARSENAEVDLGRVVVGDTCTIICTAADQSERYYYIYFAISEIDPGKEVASGDVLMKRVPGSYQIMAATVRQGVTFALFDQYGHMVYYSRVPVANPNDVDIVEGSDQHEYLNNVTDVRSGLIVDVIPGQPYFYSFFADETKRLSSGKFMCY